VYVNCVHELCDTKNLSGIGVENEFDLEPGYVRVLRLEANYWFEVYVMVLLNGPQAKNLW
jgi:hypothetical protein